MTTVAVDPEIIGAVVTALVAAFGAFGSILLVVYRCTTSLTTVLHGENGDEGFIETTRASQHELSEQQQQILAQLAVQGRLMNELVYSFDDIAEALNEELDEDIDMDRMQDLQERAADSRWGDDSRCDD